LKIETIVTAIVFLSVGFLSGFIYKSHKDSSLQPQAAVADLAAPATGMPAAAGGQDIDPATGLPRGHPPLAVARTIKNYEDLAAQNPQNAEIPLHLANLLYDQKYYNVAIEWYQKALALDPKNINARTDLGTSYFYSGDPQAAIKQYQQVLADSPGHQPTIFNMIVVNLEGLHNARAAEKYWKQLERMNPDYPGLNDLKQRLGAAGRPARAASE
jgi:predicted TPR repeat methyltransferase